MINHINLVAVTPENVHKETFFCIKDIKSPGFENIRKGFEEQYKEWTSNYGVFSILHNGKLLENHYISATRFRNILKKEIDVNWQN